MTNEFVPTPAPAFIGAVTELHFPGFNGRILRCQFDKASFTLSCFAQFAIDCPTALASAVPKRQAEFFAGRYIAMNTMVALGIPPVQIPISANRAPLWPDHIIGSITHHRDAACCAMAFATDHTGVGIDLEICMQVDTAENTWGMIINTTERQLLMSLNKPFAQLMTLVFSAKESLFKALYPVVKRYFDFLDAELLVLDLHKQEFQIALKTDLHDSLPAGRCFTGHFTCADDEVLTLIWY